MSSTDSQGQMKVRLLDCLHLNRFLVYQTTRKALQFVSLKQRKDY